MPRQLNFRQIEAFKAVIEHGTVTRAASMLNITQPAMSKLIAHLELDTGIKLFDRRKCRLVPTRNAKRLYEEVGRIFDGILQVENVVGAIRREEQGQIMVGVMPALSGSFIQRATMSFLKNRSKTFCMVHSLTSHSIVECLITRKLDVGLIEHGIDNPYLITEPLMEHSLVCIMPLNHPLAAKKLIKPNDFDHIPFVSLDSESHAGRLVEDMFETYDIKPQIVLVANVATTLCEFVAAGLGISLVHPLVMSGLENRLIVRRFEPEILLNFQLCRTIDSKNTKLIEIFAQEVRATATRISNSVLNEF